MKNIVWIKVLLGLLLLAVAAGVPPLSAQSQGSWNNYLPFLYKPSVPTGLLCRFGITTLMNMPGYLDLNIISQLRSGSLMDWDSARPAEMPADMSYVAVIPTGVKFNPNVLSWIPEWVQRHPGATWQIGNEPDAYLQDNASPEEYAQHYYAVATVFRQKDPTAKLAFGTVVQPTPLRRVYLDRAWMELSRLAGGQAQASALVDIWAIHAYLLGEMPGEWGVGRYPKGMTGTEAKLLRFGNVADADHYDFSRTHDVTLVAALIRDFRAWMAAKGERAKPLYITEYGVAFPPIDPPTRDVYNVSDADSGKYLVDTFEFFRTATDASTGLPSDNDLLVQRWYWFTINEIRYKFGGVLVDINSGQITEVGQAYINYTANIQGEPTCNP